jgi:hypothetical protein
VVLWVAWVESLLAGMERAMSGAERVVIASVIDAMDVIVADGYECR